MLHIPFCLSLHDVAPHILTVAEFFALYCKSQDFTFPCVIDEHKDCSQPGFGLAMPLKEKWPQKRFSSPGPEACEAEYQVQADDLLWLKAESTKPTKRRVVPEAKGRMRWLQQETAHA